MYSAIAIEVMVLGLSLGSVQTPVLTCEEIATAAVAKHPRLDAAVARSQAAWSRSRREGSLQSPEASIEVWDFPIGTPQRARYEGMYMLGIGQEFPAFGALGHRARAEAETARALESSVNDVTRTLWGDVAVACAEYRSAQALRVGLLGHRKLLKDMREAMVARYRTGEEALSGVSRVDAELAKADRHVEEAEAQVETTRNILATFTSDPAALAEGLTAGARPERAAVPDINSLMDQARSNRGDLRALSARQRGAEALADAAAIEARVPSFSVQATYMQTPMMRAGLGAMVGVSLPWLWGNKSHELENARHEHAAVAADVADFERTIRIELTRALGQVQTLSRSLDLLQQREIPATERALESERAGLGAGAFNLVSWIQAAHARREAHIDEIRVQAAWERAWMELQTIVGQRFVRLPRPSLEEAP